MEERGAVNEDIVFFVSDTHFGHEKILELDKRPFDSIEEHDQFIIDGWNDVVKPHYTVFHLGDFAFRNERPPEWYTERLNGNITLILGNHDEKCRGFRTYPFLFTAVLPSYHEVRMFKKRLTLCHYSMRTWRGAWAGHWHLHGHSHGTLPRRPGSLDVGVNVVGYRPISFAEVRQKIEPFEGFSHHITEGGEDEGA
jgi:calcineurin-like phosphoesterase family protein